MPDPDGLSDLLPRFLVIGAQKSASTFLQDQMAQHPQLEIARGEVRFFEDPHYSPDRLSLLAELFEGPSSLVRGIKRPDYLGLPEVAPRLAAHLPHASLFVVLREPIARAISSYYHYVRHGFVPLLPIDDAFTAILDGDLGSRFPRARQIVDYGLYGEQLQRFHAYFDRSQIHVFDQVPLTRDPDPHLRRAFEALGVDPHFTARQPERVSNKGVYSPLRLRLLRTKNKTVYRYAPDLSRREPRRKTPLGWAYNAGVVALDRAVLSHFDTGRPAQLSERVRRRLEDFYAADAPLLRDALRGSGVHPTWLPDDD